MNQDVEPDEVWKFPSMSTLLREEDQPFVDSMVIDVVDENAAALAAQQVLIQEKLEGLTLLSQRLQETLETLDSALLSMILSVIEQTSQKLIMKELSIEPRILHAMIERALETIKEQTSSIDILLSPDDFSRMQEIPFSQTVKLIADSHLAPHDFIIKTPINSIHSILTTQLNDLFGLE